MKWILIFSLLLIVGCQEERREFEEKFETEVIEFKVREEPREEVRLSIRDGILYIELVNVELSKGARLFVEQIQKGYECKVIEK